jgi:hypothetical protein
VFPPPPGFLSASAGAASISARAHAKTAASLEGTEGMDTASNIRRQMVSRRDGSGRLFEGSVQVLKPRK